MLEFIILIIAISLAISLIAPLLSILRVWLVPLTIIGGMLLIALLA